MKVKELAAGFGVGVVLASSLGMAVYEKTTGCEVGLSTQIPEAELVLAFQNLSALSALQSGDVAKAMDLLEVSLSLNAAVLHELSSRYQVDEADRINSILKRIADYRAAHPYESGDREADTRVEKILRGSKDGKEQPASDQVNVGPRRGK